MDSFVNKYAFNPKQDDKPEPTESYVPTKKSKKSAIPFFIAIVGILLLLFLIGIFTAPGIKQGVASFNKAPLDLDIDQNNFAKLHLRRRFSRKRFRFI